MAKATGDTKICSACKKPLPISEFGKNKKQPDGLQNACNDCRHDYWNKWYLKQMENPEFKDRMNLNCRSQQLKKALKKYNLTLEEYEALEAKGCGICGGPPTGRGRYAFDHDHETNEFRGLLCSHCNTAIGLFKDNLLLFSKAQQYLICTSDKY